ncbi:hypothetical protein CPB84DRAFT_1828266 [Gymnopilus junonius]|uniref:Uncharacterized protein n=1 Tax=Gymnopilus junonius TaxID=109634 RepID=A0A9P5TH22_GYMJU|nr:hypothetical protein CPB84DRAFT_1828266 [Gymnopilus junonius]
MANHTRSFRGLAEERARTALIATRPGAWAVAPIATLLSQRRKRSGLTGIELQRALSSFRSLFEKAQREHEINKAEIPEEDEDEDADAELKHMEGVIEWLQAKADGPQHLEKWDISRTQILQLKLDAISRAVLAVSIGSDELWSADTLYRHLHMLEGLVPQKNEAAARLWINAFLYRVAAMTPIYFPGCRIPHTLSGYIDWAVITTTKKNAVDYLDNPYLQKLKKEDSALFISEAKDAEQGLSSHVPQALAEMYGCARTVGKPTIRGVLTNGHSWIFLILTLKDGGGTNYVQSRPLSIYIIQNLNRELSKENISVISAILTFWMLILSHKELNADDDYFVYDSSYPG